jgi:hypothetical protein
MGNNADQVNNTQKTSEVLLTELQEVAASQLSTALKSDQLFQIVTRNTLTQFHIAELLEVLQLLDMHLELEQKVTATLALLNQMQAENCAAQLVSERLPEEDICVALLNKVAELLKDHAGQRETALHAVLRGVIKHRLWDTISPRNLLIILEICTNQLVSQQTKANAIRLIVSQTTVTNQNFLVNQIGSILQKILQHLPQVKSGLQEVIWASIKLIKKTRIDSLDLKIALLERQAAFSSVLNQLKTHWMLFNAEISKFWVIYDSLLQNERENVIALFNTRVAKDYLKNLSKEKGKFLKEVVDNSSVLPKVKAELILIAHEELIVSANPGQPYVEFATKKSTVLLTAENFIAMQNNIMQGLKCYRTLYQNLVAEGFALPKNITSASPEMQINFSAKLLMLCLDGAKSRRPLIGTNACCWLASKKSSYQFLCESLQSLRPYLWCITDGDLIAKFGPCIDIGSGSIASGMNSIGYASEIGSRMPSNDSGDFTVRGGYSISNGSSPMPTRTTSPSQVRVEGT